MKNTWIENKNIWKYFFSYNGPIRLMQKKFLKRIYKVSLPKKEVCFINNCVINQVYKKKLIAIIILRTI